MLVQNLCLNEDFFGISVFKRKSHRMEPVKRLTLLLMLICLFGCRGEPNQPTSPSNDDGGIEAPPIYSLQTIQEDIPQYGKAELNFTVTTNAENLQLPFDPNPPAGIEPGIGITVEARFTPDDWETVFIQPAFYHQEFIEETRDGQTWLYPTDNYRWRVRFSPHIAGEWQYSVRAQDAQFEYSTRAYSFTVTPTEEHGFVQVSEQDQRYFEFDDGTYFPGIGINLNLPDNLDELPALSDNGIQLIRTYLPSQYSIWGSAWSPWQPVGAVANGPESNARLGYNTAVSLNRTPEDPPLAVPDHDFFLTLTHDETVFDDGQQWRHFPCAVFGWNTPQIPVKPDSSYQLRVRYRLEGVEGPKVANEPMGLAVKTADWLWSRQDETTRCTYPGTGNLLAASYRANGRLWQNRADDTYDGWQMMTATIETGSENFLPRLWLALENATAGQALIDEIWLEEVLPNGKLGPNVIYKSSMANHLYFDQQRSAAFDRALAEVEANDLYLKLVLMEKNDFALGAFEADGSLTMQPINQANLFFGNGRSPSKILWLQQAWWRYVQARWGYSSHIHSWELLNEGDPASEAHHILADELGRYMAESFIPEGQTTPHPNQHLVTTSFWSGYPQTFWQNDAYPYIDYADIHHYATMGEQRPFSQLYDGSEFYDAAEFTLKLSQAIGATSERSPQMPLVRGELGFIFDQVDLFEENVSDGLWLHNLLWAGLNEGGLMELYWTGAPIQNQLWSDTHDHRPIYGAYARFVQALPLNNGRYQPANAESSSDQLRVVGQMDVEAGQAHLWIQNRQHTWKNVADGVEITAVTATVQLDGFAPNTAYTVTFIDTYALEGDPTLSQTEITTDNSGILIIPVEDLLTDVAVVVGN